MNSMSSMGGLQMMLGGMMGGEPEETEEKKEKETIGFHARSKETK